MNRFLHSKYIICIISGILTASAFKYSNFNFTVWFSMMPCFYILFDSDRFELKHCFITMFLYGISFYMALFSFIWGIYPLEWRGFTNSQSIFMIALAWIVLSIFEALFLGILGILWFELNDIIKLNWLTLALLWPIVEWAQGLGPTGFTWGRIANCQYNNMYIIQSVSLFGTLFLSSIIVLANSFIADFLHNRNRYRYIVAFFAVFILNFGYGYYRIDNISIPQKNIKASVIQANVNTAEKWKDENTDEIFDIYQQLTKIADNNSDSNLDLIVWAETSIPITLNDNPEFIEKCTELSKTVNSTILIGAFESVDNLSYNAIYSVSPTDGIMSTYHKQNLVPFGEYIPFRQKLYEIFPSVADIIAEMEDLNTGKNTSLLKTPAGEVANMICFDSIFSKVARKQVLEGADIIAVQTNDSWFDGTTAIHQHLSQSVMRAVENNRYLLRAANTGISAVISSTGEILSALQPETTGYINYDVPLIETKTLYTEFGDIIVFVNIILLVILGFVRILFEYIFAPVIDKLKFYIHMLTKK